MSAVALAVKKMMRKRPAVRKRELDDYRERRDLKKFKNPGRTRDP